MTTLKLQQHERLTLDLAQFLNNLNGMPLTDITKTYISGVPVKNINTSAVLTAYKLDLAQKLPNFDTYLQAGIDLSTQIPDDEPTKAALDRIVGFISAMRLTDEKAFISFDKKADEFAVNDAGLAALEAAVIKLTPGQETVYDALQSVFALLYAHGSNLPGKFLNDTIVNLTTKKITTNSMVNAIVSNIK